MTHAVAGKAQACFVLAFVILFSSRLAAQDLHLSPTRPTVANSAGIQDKGVLQVEAGYDAYPPSIAGSQQTVGISLFYVPLSKLRLDYGWAPFSHQKSEQGSASGAGTMQVGGKVVLLSESYHHALPGIGLQYEAELPTASDPALQGFGQQVTLLLNHHYGRDGILDVIVNGSLVQSDCDTRAGCSYGGQQSLALSYHLNEQTRLYGEVFGQNNSQSNTPPGTYAFGGFYRQINDAFGLDGGLRFGVSAHSARVGTTFGLVYGKRLGRSTAPTAERH